MKRRNSDPLGRRDKRSPLDEAAAFDAIKQEMFGGKAHLATVKTAGSGISESNSASVPLVAVFEDRDNAREVLSCSGPWHENATMIVKLFGPILERVRECPGSESSQCCHAEPGQSCFPNWREREDAEWYALKIHQLMGQVSDRIKGEGKLVPALAADEAFELGCLFQEALIRFGWNEAARAGRKVVQGGRNAGAERRYANPKRRSSEETISAVDGLLAQGVGKMKAYALVAKQQGVTEQSIGKEYQRKKS